MQLELIAFWGFVCIILIALAEMRQSFRMLGFIGCVLLIPLAFWIWTTGVEIQTGSVTTISTTTNTTISSSIEVGTQGDSIINTRANLPYMNLAQLLSTLLFGMAAYGSYHYVALLGIPDERYSSA